MSLWTKLICRLLQTIAKQLVIMTAAIASSVAQACFDKDRGLSADINIGWLLYAEVIVYFVPTSTRIVKVRIKLTCVCLLQ